MTIQPSLRNRLPYMIFGFGMAGAMVVISMLAVIYQQANPVLMAVVGILGAALFAGLGYAAGGTSALRADGDTLTYYSVLGKPKTISRKRLAAIVRVPGIKGLYELEFRAQDGKVLLDLDDKFPHPDLQSLSDFLGVTLRLQPD